MDITGKLQTLVENVPKTFRAGRLNPIVNSTYCNGKVSDTTIMINDVLPIEHDVNCKLSSKNLFDISQIPTTSQVINNGDGTLTINENAVSTNRKLSQVCPALKVGDTAVISLRITNSVQDGKKQAYIYLYGVKQTWPTGEKRVITQADLDSYVFVYNKWWVADNSVDDVTTGTVSEIQVELGSTATEYTPYVADVGGIEVTRYGKNLFDKSNYNIIGNDIGFDISSLEIGKTYTFSSSIPIAYFKISSNGYGYNSVLKATNDLFNTFTFVMARHENISPTSKQYIFICKERVEDPFVENISELDGYDFQLEEGSSATSYTPYIEPVTYTAKADGTVEGVKSISPNMTLLTNNNGVVINANYYKDPDIVISNLMQNVALSGGES